MNSKVSLNINDQTACKADPWCKCISECIPMMACTQQTLVDLLKRLCPNTNRYTSNNIKDSYPLPTIRLLEHFLVWAVTVVPTLFLETTVASSRSLLPSTTMLLILGSEAPNLRLSGEVLGGIIVADLCSVGDRQWSLRNTFLGLRLLLWFSDKREDTSESM